MADFEEFLKLYENNIKNGPKRYYGYLKHDNFEEENNTYGVKKTEKKSTKKAATKLPTEKRHKDDYKRLKGNIQKSRSDLHVNKKTGKREITTSMTIHKGLTAKEKAGLKKSILKAVKQHLEGSGLHIPLVGGYTSSLIFHEMGKYIPPKDRKLMKKLIEESRPPRPPPIHSGAIDEEDAVAIVKPIDTGNMSASDYEDSGTESESDKEVKYRYMKKEPDSDSESDDEIIGSGFIDDFYGGNKQDMDRATQSLANSRNERDRLKAEVLARNAQLLADAKARKAGTGIKRPRGRPRKIQL